MQRHTQERIAQVFTVYDCELLSVYLHSRIKVQFRCKCGNIDLILFPNYKRQNYRCKICGYQKVGAKKCGSNNGFWNPNCTQVQQNTIMAKRAKTLLKNCLQRIGKVKEGHTHDILGYSAQELMAYLQSFDTWEELQDKNWHIDHKYPVKAFVDHGIIDLGIINNLDNLQPLLGNENQSKRDWYDEDCFLAYCKRHGLTVTKLVKTHS